MVWHVYMLRCVDGSLYTGITTDLDRRVEEHNRGTKGARYTRARRPVSLVYSETSESRATASSREYTIKQLTPEAKAELVRSGEKQ